MSECNVLEIGLAVHGIVQIILCNFAVWTNIRVDQHGKIKPINQADGQNTVFIVSQLQTCNAMISSLFRNTDYCFCLLVTSPERS